MSSDLTFPMCRVALATCMLASLMTVPAAAIEPAARTPEAATVVKPKPLSDPQIPGFRFPEAEATILRWVAESASSDGSVRREAERKINLHAWGLWTALTAKSGEVLEGQELRVFETWYTPQNIRDSREWRLLEQIPRRPRTLVPLRQLAD